MTIEEFDTIASHETQAIDAYNDAHHFRTGTHSRICTRTSPQLRLTSSNPSTEVVLAEVVLFDCDT